MNTAVYKIIRFSVKSIDEKVLSATQSTGHEFPNDIRLKIQRQKYSMCKFYESLVLLLLTSIIRRSQI